eukprot:355846-Chlamydomonas_euryale.AAC.2
MSYIQIYMEMIQDLLCPENDNLVGARAAPTKGLPSITRPDAMSTSSLPHHDKPSASHFLNEHPLPSLAFAFRFKGQQAAAAGGIQET